MIADGVQKQVTKGYELLRNIGYTSRRARMPRRQKRN